MLSGMNADETTLFLAQLERSAKVATALFWQVTGAINDFGGFEYDPDNRTETNRAYEDYRDAYCNSLGLQFVMGLMSNLHDGFHTPEGAFQEVLMAVPEEIEKKYPEVPASVERLQSAFDAELVSRKSLSAKERAAANQIQALLPFLMPAAEMVIAHLKGDGELTALESLEKNITKASLTASKGAQSEVGKC